MKQCNKLTANNSKNSNNSLKNRFYDKVQTKIGSNNSEVVLTIFYQQFLFHKKVIKMGTWNTRIKGNDTTLDIYQSFFDMYNEGHEPQKISEFLRKKLWVVFDDDDEKHNALFGLVLAQWETKSLEGELYEEVKKVIENEENLELWKENGEIGKITRRRNKVLQVFLEKISKPRQKPKRRISVKLDFYFNDLLKLKAPDKKKDFFVCEWVNNGQYMQTTGSINWLNSGGSIFNFTNKNMIVKGKWLNSQTLEVFYNEEISFHEREMKVYNNDDEVTIIYKCLKQ